MMTRKFGICLCWALLIIAGTACENASKQYVVKDGKSNAKIVLPAKAGPASLFAAEELQGYLKKITGADVSIVDYGKDSEGLVQIILAPEKYLADKPMATGREDDFTIEQAGSSITISGLTELSVIYGVYQYLDNMEVRWFMPGDIGENVPKMKNIEVEEGIEMGSPDFAGRGIAYSSIAETHLSHQHLEQQIREYALWLIRNRCPYSRFIRKATPYKFNYNPYRDYHNIGKILKNVDIGEEPERFPLVTRDGITKRRDVDEHVQICFTDQRNIDKMVAQAIDFFTKNPEMVSYPCSLEDWNGMCECENCVKANRGVFPPLDPNAVVWNFMNKVAAKLRTEMPDKKIAFYAVYASMTSPPPGITADPGILAIACHSTCNAHALEDTTCPHNQYFLSNVEKCHLAGAEIGSYDYTCFHGYLQPLAILENLKLYKELGYTFYSCESMGRDEHRNIISWMLARLSWDSSQDPYELLNTFCRAYYGEGGNAVYEALITMDREIRKQPMLVYSTRPIVRAPQEKIMGLLKEAEKKVYGKEKERIRRLTLSLEMLFRHGDNRVAFTNMVNERTEESQMEAVETISSFLTNFKANSLGETVSPVIYEMEKKRLKAAEEYPLKYSISRSKSLKNASRETMLEELFSLDVPPKKVSNLFYLPEIMRVRLDPDYSAPVDEWISAAFDDSAWGEVSTWNMLMGQGIGEYEGGFCYRVAFDAPRFPEGARVFMRVGSIDDAGTFYLNGKQAYVRDHLKNFDWETSFEFELTALLKQGEENLFAVYGNNSTGGLGLYRPVALYTK